MADPSASSSSSSKHPSTSHHLHQQHHPHSHHHRRSHTTSHQSSTKRPARPAIKRVDSAGSTKGKRVVIEVDLEKADEFDDMAASFPQFCTVCESQIVVPSNLILYCSESCRRRDTNKPLSPSLSEYSPPSTPTPACAEDPMAPRDIIPQRSPTAISTHRFSYVSISSASSDNEAEEDTDDSRDQRRQSLHHRRQHSEAARYLRSFQSPAFQAEIASRPSRRPNPISRSSTASLAPSLTHSSSLSTSPVTPISSLPYSRPLPPRTNPWSSSFASKSVSLVTPFAGAQSMPPTAFAGSSLAGLKSRPSIGTNVGADELPDQLPAEELRYEKKDMIERAGSDGPGNLKTLFRFNEMQAPP